MVMTDQEFRKSISETKTFMFALYRQYNGDKLTTMSPISIMLLMSMLANGASGESYDRRDKAQELITKSIQSEPEA